MFRVSRKINAGAGRKISKLWHETVALQSTSSKSSKALVKGLAVASGVSSLSVGVIGYAAWSPENRKFIENKIPGSNYALAVILGSIIEEKEGYSKIDTSKKLGHSEKKEGPSNLSGTKTSTTKLPPSELPTSPSETLPPTKLPTSPPIQNLPTKKDNVEKDSKSDLKSGLPTLPLPTTTEPVDSEKPSETNESSKEKSEPIKKEINDESKELAVQLQQFIDEAQSMVTSALSSSKKATEAVKEHAERAYQAIDSGEGQEALFKMAAEVAQLKKETLKITDEKLQLAREKIENLHKLIDSVKNTKTATSASKLIASAEETISELYFAMSKIKSNIAEAVRDESVVGEYRKLVQACQTQFEAEVKSLHPDVRIGEKSDKLTTDELNMLLLHAHSKVIALQKALAKQQTIDKERFKESVLRQRETESKFVGERLNVELERQRRELGLEHRHRLQQLREDFEIELRNQLKRLASAHSDHIAELLDQQEKKLDDQYFNKLQDELQKESDKHYMSLAKLQGQINGIKSGLATRARVDETAHSSHELWLACESLKMALRLGETDENLLPLENHINNIKNITGEKDSFIRTVIKSIPDMALTRGVFTAQALKERFIRVDSVCKKVALVQDENASLARYLLSYLQSLFVVGSYDRMSTVEASDEKIDVEKLNVHDLLARARYCIAKDDLLQATKYLNQLSGEPKNVACDWLNEVRLYLEAQQVADAIMAYATSMGSKAL